MHGPQSTNLCSDRARRGHRELKNSLEKLRTEWDQFDVGKIEAMNEGHLQNQFETESFHNASRAYQQSLELGELVCDEQVGR
jgi:hypothetical protein